MPGDSRTVELVLASSSPRRRELLERIGLPFVIVPSEVVEREPGEREDPAAYALALAREKASDVACDRSGHVVLGADTIVTLDERILGKPENERHAVAMLELLSGRTHRVITGVCVRRGHHEFFGSVTSRVHMKVSTLRHLTEYVDTGEPMDKAGAYAVQGRGALLIDRVLGCYFNVVGLPLCLTVELLSLCGVDIEPGMTEMCEHRNTWHAGFGA